MLWNCFLMLILLICFSVLSTAKPTPDEYWSAMMEMFNNGPRLTGSAGHKKFLDTVTNTLKSLNFTVNRDEMKFKRWQADNFSLIIHGSNGDEAIDVAYPFVRSGLTKYSGITLPLGGTLDLFNHIAVTSGQMSILGPTGCNLPAIALEPAAKAAICCIKNQPKIQLKGDYQPFTNGLMKPALPTLMVGSDECAKITAAQKNKQKATLVLAGTEEQDTTAHIWGLLPGQTDDVVMVGVHSDGQNAIEENGVPSILTMMKYLAALPLKQRKRTLGFAAVTGHMDYDVPKPETQGFASLHANDLMKKVKVCIAPEHFGTMKWHVDNHGNYVSTGKTCEYTGYGSNGALLSQVKKAFKENKVTNAVTLTGPVPEEAGSALGWRLHGCPTIGGISLPDYLVNLDHGGPDKLDKNRFFELASAYLQIIEEQLAGASVE